MLVGLRVIAGCLYIALDKDILLGKYKKYQHFVRLKKVLIWMSGGADFRKKVSGVEIKML